MESAGGYLAMWVIAAKSQEDACHRVLAYETRCVDVMAKFLGLAGTDELAHAEDEWAMGILEHELFGRGGVALGRLPDALRI